MSSHILVNSLGLTYKGTIGISTATIPDVCKTPSPGGPVPIPYPNIAQQSSLRKGTKTVKAKGKMIAIKGSQYGRSNGDEPGTAGGVKSNVNMKATDWITYSFDVMMDGKNACRHTDKKFHNNQNTVDLQGNVDPALARSTAKERLIDILCECHASNPPQHPSEPCTDIGNRVDKCCKDAIANLPQPSGVSGERSYDRNYNPIADSQGQPMDFDAAAAAGVDLTGASFPDACAVDGNGNPTQFFDFKTVCPKGHPYKDASGKIKRASGDPASAVFGFHAPKKGRKSQFQRYKEIGESLNPPTEADPEILSTAECASR
ncbi:MAG: DUF4150 domain-containing protein [Kiloniellales bacterium]|nr:DUF4150 domain-containing protein [Kiloniellales bacterium]